MDHGRKRGDVGRAVDQRSKALANRMGIDGRQVALHVDDESDLAGRIEFFQRFEDAVGTGFMVRPRHHRLAAMRLDGIEHGLRVGGDDHPSQFRLLRPAQYLHDHRQAGDVGQRLAGQPGRRHARGNEHKDLRRTGGRRSVHVWHSGCGNWMVKRVNCRPAQGPVSKSLT